MRTYVLNDTVDRSPRLKRAFTLSVPQFLYTSRSASHPCTESVPGGPPAHVPGCPRPPSWLHGTRKNPIVENLPHQQPVSDNGCHTPRRNLVSLVGIDQDRLTPWCHSEDLRRQKRVLVALMRQQPAGGIVGCDIDIPFLINGADRLPGSIFSA